MDFDDCVKEAIRLGRKWMNNTEKSNRPTREEWALAVALYTRRENGL